MTTPFITVTVVSSPRKDLIPFGKLVVLFYKWFYFNENVKAILSHYYFIATSY